MWQEFGQPGGRPASIHGQGALPDDVAWTTGRDATAGAAARATGRGAAGWAGVGAGGATVDAAGRLTTTNFTTVTGGAVVVGAVVVEATATAWARAAEADPAATSASRTWR